MTLCEVGAWIQTTDPHCATCDLERDPEPNLNLVNNYCLWLISLDRPSGSITPLKTVKLLLYSFYSIQNLK